MKEEAKNIELQNHCKNPFCKADIPTPDPKLYSSLFCDDCKVFIIDDKFRRPGNRTQGFIRQRIKITKDYIQDLVFRILNYIDNPRNKTGIPAILGFCALNKISQQHLTQVLSDKHEDVKEALEVLRNTAQYLISEKMSDKFNPGLIFYLKQFGWKDTQENNNNISIEPPEFNGVDDNKLNERIDSLINKRNRVE